MNQPDHVRCRVDREDKTAIVSAVIATHARHAVLRRTFRTVLEQDYPADKYEIIVVIDGPDDRTSHWLSGLHTTVRLRIVEQPQRGLAAARNAGIMEASGERVLFLDDDLLCDRGLIRRHAAVAHDGSLVAFGPVLVSGDSPQTVTSEWVRRAAEARMARLQQSGPDWPTDIAVCANYSAPRRLLLACGGFDESFVGACEEFDLGIRLKNGGAEFRYLPDAVAYEIYVKTASEVVAGDCQARGRNEVRLCRKHPEYRSVSLPAHFNAGPPMLRALRRITVRAPFSPDIFLAPVFRVAEAARGFSVGRRVADRVLEFRRGAALFRSAVREAGSWDSFCREFAITLPVLLYHHVGSSPCDTDPDSVISPARFEQQMRWLARHGYQTIMRSQWLGWCKAGAPIPPRPIMLAFDDVCAELAKYAFPALTQHGFGAAVFRRADQSGGTEDRDPQLRRGSQDVMTAEQMRHWAVHGIEFYTPSKTGADFACAGQEQGLNSLGTDPTLLKHIRVRPAESLLEFSMRVRMGWNPFENLHGLISLASASAAFRRAVTRLAARRETIT